MPAAASACWKVLGGVVCSGTTHMEVIPQPTVPAQERPVQVQGHVEKDATSQSDGKALPNAAFMALRSSS